MLITNKFHLPNAMVSAMQNDGYAGPQNELKRISVSTIKDSPRIHFLKVNHWDELEEDVADGLWKMLGTAIHTLLERADKSESIKEQRIDVELDGITISGQMDVRDNDEITDYKSTSVWTIIYNPGGKKEWIQQLNIYAWLVWKSLGKKINKLSVNAILRDHTGSKVAEGSNYPKIPFAMVNLPVWTVEQTEAYLKGRIALFKGCVGLKDNELPLCTDEEIWLKKGKAGRCEKYCQVNKFCNQYKENK